jgi:hypothetical protein
VVRGVDGISVERESDPVIGACMFRNHPRISMEVLTKRRILSVNGTLPSRTRR